MDGIATMLQPHTFDPATAELTFTIAATDYALRAIAVPLLAVLKQRAPRVRVALVAVQHDDVQAQLERGQVDLALLTPQSTPPDLHARQLFREHYTCLLRVGHPAVRGRRLTLKQFCALDHALVSYGGERFSGATDVALQAVGAQRRVSLSVQSFLVLPDILRATDMVAVVPSRLANGLEGLVTIAPPVEVEGFTKTAVWHERTHRTPSHRWLRDVLVEVCASGAAPLSRRR